MLHILIYDDNPAVCKELQHIISEQVLPEDSTVDIATTSEEAKRLLLTEISILFLDIKLQDQESGIDFARYVNQTFPKTKIIFITAYIRYCEEIFTVRPDGFLVKPITAEKVRRTLQILAKNKEQQDVLIIHNSRNQMTKVELKQIAFIESTNRRLLLYQENGEILYEFFDKLSTIETQLPDYFWRCHHSFSVNLHFVNHIQRYHFTLQNGTTVPISQQKFKASKERFMTFLGESI